MKKFSLIILVFIGVITLSSCRQQANSSPISQSTKQKQLNLSQQQPIIFLHGSGGSATNLVPFATSLLAETATPTAKLLVTISQKNQLSYEGALTDSKALPLIFVGFEDNVAPIEDWSQSLAVLLADLVAHYQFREITLVGFSNGGLAAGYFTEIASDFTGLPSTTKLVMIGAPFNDLEPLNHLEKLDFTDQSNRDPYLDKFIAKKKQLDPHLAVLSIAGDVGTTPPSDSVVPVTSALASRLIFPDFVSSYEERLSKGDQASHVGLVDGNQDVVAWVSDFLFKPDIKNERETLVK